VTLTAWKTYASGDILTAADMNTYQRDNGRHMTGSSTGGGPMCRVTHSTTQSIANATETSLAFDTERFDVGPMHDPVTNNSRITVPASQGGKYLVGAQLAWQSNVTSAGRRDVRLRVDGATYWGFAGQVVDVGSGAEQYHTIASLITLAAASYVEVRGFQNQGSAQNVQQYSNYSPEFWAVWLKE